MCPDVICKRFFFSNVFLLLKDFETTCFQLLAIAVLMRFLGLLTIIPYHPRFVIMLAFDKNVAFKCLPFLELTFSCEFKHKILLDDYKVRPELNKHKNI